MSLSRSTDTTANSTTCRLCKMKMNKKTSTRAIIFKILMLIYIFAVMYLCFANFRSIPDVPREMFGIPIDKVIHFCMFFPFPIFGFYAYDRLTDTPLKAIAAVIILFCYGGIFAGLTEMVQGMIIYRSEDIRDFKADLLGLGLASFIVLMIDIVKMRLSRK